MVQIQIRETARTRVPYTQNQSMMERSIDSYADAVAAGNVFLYLPREIRQMIISWTVTAEIKSNKSTCTTGSISRSSSTSSLFDNGGRASFFDDASISSTDSDPDEDRTWLSIEAQDMVGGRQCTWLPPICLVNDCFFFDALPIVLQQVNFVVRSLYGAFNLFFFLQTTDMLACARSILFHTSDAFVISSAGAQILTRCGNLRRVGLNFETPMLKQACAKRDSSEEELTIDMKWFAEAYSFDRLLALNNIEQVRLFFRDHEMPHDLVEKMATWLRERSQKQVHVVSTGHAGLISKPLY